jgi:hypothetical protein
MFETLNQIEVKVVNITSLKERVTTFTIVSSLHLANLLLHFGIPSFLPSFSYSFRRKWDFSRIKPRLLLFQYAQQPHHDEISASALLRQRGEGSKACSGAAL